MATGNGRVSVLLVAEPDESVRRLRARLRAEGCSVETVQTGEAALIAAAKRFDLILLDLNLPDGEGLALLRHLCEQENSAATPIFLLKGEGEPSHVVQRGLDVGASGYVSKHRLPQDLAATSLVDNLILVTAPSARPDTCPYSSRHEFGRCAAYLPLSIPVGDDGSEPLGTCSHLRIGTADTWRLYPRCALGDQASRDRYLEDSAIV